MSKTLFYEVKRSYTDLINLYVADEKEKLKVFDCNGVYLPMKKVGKNNPKAEQIKADNQVRVKRNQTVDRALVSGVPEEQILEVKQKEITKKCLMKRYWSLQESCISFRIRGKCSLTASTPKMRLASEYQSFVRH